MRKAIADLDEVLVIARYSKTVMPCGSRPARSSATHSSSSRPTPIADQAVLSSSLHQMWAIKYGSGMGTILATRRRTCSRRSRARRHRGWTRSARRSTRSAARSCCAATRLTKLYNLVNDPDIADASDADVARLRAIHVELDEAVMDAYGWTDVPLDHGFHTYRQMERWTVSPAARVEILDRLLEENHRRAAAQGSAAAGRGR